MLQGKTAMVTGAGSGIGRASALTLARSGASVLVTDIDMASAESVVGEIEAAGGTARPALCDIGSEDSISAAVATAVRTFGRLDIAHNNAALLSTEALTLDQDILDIPIKVWDDIMEVTLRGTMLCCRHAITAMLESGGGSIINTSSIFGLSAANRMPAYGVSKAGVNMLTEYVAVAYGRRNIRCNAVAPSMMRTPTLERLIGEEVIAYNADAALTPFLGEPQDVANVVAFLASDAARYLTGQVIRVDGGTTNHLATYSAERDYLARMNVASADATPSGSLSG